MTNRKIKRLFLNLRLNEFITIQRGNVIISSKSEAAVSAFEANVKLSSLYKAGFSDAGRAVYTKKINFLQQAGLTLLHG